jgi:hypothetical protein
MMWPRQPQEGSSILFYCTHKNNIFLSKSYLGTPLSSRRLRRESSFIIFSSLPPHLNSARVHRSNKQRDEFCSFFVPPSKDVDQPPPHAWLTDRCRQPRQARSRPKHSFGICPSAKQGAKLPRISVDSRSRSHPDSGRCISPERIV